MTIETRWPSSGIVDYVAVGPDGEIALEYTERVVGNLWLICEHGTEVEVTPKELATMLADLLNAMGQTRAAGAVENYVLPLIRGEQ